MPDLTKAHFYTPELAAIICEKIASGQSLLSICKADDMPNISNVFVWLHKHKDFQDNYVGAREAWAEAEFEEMMRIADTPQMGEKIKVNDDGIETTTGDMTEHRKLQIDTRKWVLARMSPRKFGDKIKQEITNPDGSLAGKGLDDAAVTARLNAIIAAAKSKKELAEKGNAASDLV